MPTERREVEARGKDVDAAIENGLQRLGLSRKDVIIEVVDEGSRGLLGIGGRDAIVRITSMVPVSTSPKRAEPAPTPPPPERAPEPKSEPVSQPKPEAAPAAAPPPSKPAAAEAPAAPAEETPAPAEAKVDSAVELEDDMLIAREVIETLLDKIGVEATISTRETEPDDLSGQQYTIFDIQGEDLGLLIGPRGETLNALQYISRLIVGHKLQQRANFIIDVEAYRQRREKALTRLAERMAQKVTQRQRPLSLEPMPPHERRIIHVALRNDDNVYTQSTGEGKRRKVRIHPKD